MQNKDKTQKNKAHVATLAEQLNVEVNNDISIESLIGIERAISREMFGERLSSVKSR